MSKKTRGVLKRTKNFLKRGKTMLRKRKNSAKNRNRIIKTRLDFKTGSRTTFNLPSDPTLANARINLRELRRYQDLEPNHSFNIKQSKRLPKEKQTKKQREIRPLKLNSPNNSTLGRRRKQQGRPFNKYVPPTLRHLYNNPSNKTKSKKKKQNKRENRMPLISEE